MKDDKREGGKKLCLDVNDLRAIAEVNKIALKLKEMKKLLKIRKDEKIMFNVMYYRKGSQVDNYKDNTYDTFEQALDEALSEVESGSCDRFDITRWETEDEGELYCIWEDGIITFGKELKN